MKIQDIDDDIKMLRLFNEKTKTDLIHYLIKQNISIAENLIADITKKRLY